MSHSQFESAVKNIPFPQETVYCFLSDLRHFDRLRERLADPAVQQQLGERMPNIPTDELAKQLRDMTLDEDSMTFSSPMGMITLRIIDRDAPKCLKFEADGSPIPLNVWIQLLPVTPESCKMRVTLRAEVNMFMKAMVSKPLQQAVDSMAETLAHIPYDN